MALEHNILSGNLACTQNIDGLHIYRYLEEQHQKASEFVENLILHDKILIPVQDFTAPIALAKIFGPNSIIHLLQEGRIKFVRTKGMIGYLRGTGNDGGIIVTKTPDLNKKADTADIDISIDMSLNAFYPNADNKNLLKNELIKNTSEVDLAEQLGKSATESKADVKSSPLWKSVFEYDVEKGLFQFPNMEKMQVRTFGPNSRPASNIVDYYLRCVLVNMELSMASDFLCCSISTNQPSGLLIERKINRLLKSKVDTKNYMNLRQLAEIPDIGKVVFQNPSKIDDLIKLCNSSSSIKFRKWFHEHSSESEIELCKAYVELLKDVPWIQKDWVKIIRFVFSTWAGSIPIPNELIDKSFNLMSEKVLSPILGAGDAFVVERIFNNKSTKYFIDKLSKFQGKPA